jgi:hypothetical protein
MLWRHILEYTKELQYVYRFKYWNTGWSTVWDWITCVGLFLSSGCIRDSGSPVYLNSVQTSTFPVRAFWVYLVTEYHTSRSPPWCVSNERRHRSRKPEPSPSLRSSHTCAHDVKSGQTRQTFWQSILTSDGLMEDNSPRDTRGPYDQGHTTNNVSLQHRTTPT